MKIPFFSNIGTGNTGELSWKNLGWWNNQENFSSQLKTLLVKLYQNLGLLALIIIFALISGYFLLVGFFFINRHWSIPFILNPHSEKVLLMRKQYIQTMAEMDALKTKKQFLEQKVGLLEEQRQGNEKLGSDMQVLLRQEREERVQALKQLDGHYRKHREFSRPFKEDLKEGGASLEKARKKLSRDFQQGLLSYEQFLGMNGDLWQGENSKLDFEMKMTELEEKIMSARKDIDSLNRLVKNEENEEKEEKEEKREKGGNLVSYGVLQMEKQDRYFREESRRLLIEIAELRGDLQATDKTLIQVQDYFGVLRQSPYVRAFDKNIVMAFVPYENMRNVKMGSAVYSCKFKIFWCERTGTVEKILEGEVGEAHPFFSREMRGRILEMNLQRVALGENDLLHIGKAPLFFLF